MNRTETSPAIPPAPAGFLMVPDADGAVVIHHRRTGMKGMLVFLSLWLTGWTAACILLAHSYLGGKIDDGTPMPVLMVLVFWASDLLVLALLLYLLFARKSYRLDNDSLTVEVNLLGYRRLRAVPRQNVRRIVQIQDGGKGEDSFPSWGLRAETTGKPLSLVFRQPYEISHWLGQVLAQWAEVDFIPAADQ